MSACKSTFFHRKFKLFFFDTRNRFVPDWIIIWPESLSYQAWQCLLKSHLWFIGANHDAHSKKPQKRKKWSHRYRKFLLAQSRQRNELVAQQTASVVKEIKTLNPVESGDFKVELITMLKQFWERKHVFQHIEKTIPDRRKQDLITYSKQSIMTSALSIFLFRMGSGNKYDDKSHDDDEKYSRKNIARFIDAPEERVPVIKTIEKFLKNLEEKSVNELMIAFFKDLQKSKFFMQHQQIMPGDFFLLAADCVHTHTYTHPHHTDMYGNNNCDCCLKRVYNKGTEHEKVRWLHNTLVFSFIFMGGLKIPIYRHPIHAKQVVHFESASEEMHKQECEIVALKSTLPIIREAFPRMKIVLLLDGLYANKPVIRLAEDLGCGYIIVRKESCLHLLARECDEHSTQFNHKKNCVKKCKSVTRGWNIEQRYEWFNNKYLGENVSTNVLRFWEKRTRESGESECYKCEWLFSWRLSAKTCELAAKQGRLRWELEDIFNSLKNRGHNLSHDYSRDPRSCFNWQGLALFAFGIFELFRFSEAVKERGELPQSTLADKLLGQLLYRPTEELFSQKCLLKKMQFRYHFVVELILTQEISQNNPEKELKTG